MANSTPSYKILVDELPKRKLADCVVCAIENRFGPNTVVENQRSVPRPFRLVYIVYQTTGFLCGDGLVGLLELPSRSTYPGYIQDLGFDELGVALRRYVRWHFFYAQSKMRATQQELYRNEDKIFDSVADYIADNVDEFETLLPYVRKTLSYLEHFDPSGYERELSKPNPRTELLKTVTEGLSSGTMTLETVKKMLRDHHGG